MKRKLLWLLPPLWPAGFFFAFFYSRSAPEHIFLITLDTTRADAIDYATAGNSLTPNLAALAAAGRALRKRLHGHPHHRPQPRRHVLFPAAARVQGLQQRPEAGHPLPDAGRDHEKERLRHRRRHLPGRAQPRFRAGQGLRPLPGELQARPVVQDRRRGQPRRLRPDRQAEERKIVHLDPLFRSPRALFPARARRALHRTHWATNVLYSGPSIEQPVLRLPLTAAAGREHHRPGNARSRPLLGDNGAFTGIGYADLQVTVAGRRERDHRHGLIPRTWSAAANATAWSRSTRQATPFLPDRDQPRQQRPAGPNWRSNTRLKISRRKPSAAATSKRDPLPGLPDRPAAGPFEKRGALRKIDIPGHGRPRRRAGRIPARISATSIT